MFTPFTSFTLGGNKMVETQSTHRRTLKYNASKVGHPRMTDDKTRIAPWWMRCETCVLWSGYDRSDVAAECMSSGYPRLYDEFCGDYKPKKLCETCRKWVPERKGHCKSGRCAENDRSTSSDDLCKREWAART